jgi:ribosome-associated protein
MDGLQIAELSAIKALEKKAENVVILDLGGKSSVADYFVVCSGMSDRQVSAMAAYISDTLKEYGVKPFREEGVKDGRWALIDFGTVIVHVFLDHMRDFYNLEGLWHEAKRIRISEDKAHVSYSADNSQRMQI